MSAIVDVPLQARRHERSLELWSWELPSRRLRSRREVEDERRRATAEGVLLPIAEDHPHLIAGEHSAVWSRAGDELLVTVSTAPRHDAIANLIFPDATAVHLRALGDIVTVFSDDGRVIALDVRTHEMTANFSHGER